MSLTNAIDDVRTFHDACDVPVSKSPTWPELHRLGLRLRLLQEEMEEIRRAVDDDDIPGVTQELADLIYVTIGMALEMGLPLGNAWNATHAANMRKVDPRTGKARKREDGKVLKPAGWQGADIAAIVNRAKYKESP